MIGYVIKFKDGSYHAGYGKSNSKTIVGAQIYRSYKKAYNIATKAVSFPTYNHGWEIVRVKLEEVETVEV